METYRLWGLVVAGALLLVPQWVGAVKDVKLLALTRDKVILRIDGVRRVLAAGETSPEGVSLVHADTNAAEVVIDGRRERLPLAVVVAPIKANAGSQPVRVTLWADTAGFFFADGKINGDTVRFLVDTGASAVALNGRHAKSLGLDYKKGKQGVASTANGLVRIYQVTLDTVAVGGITLYDVPAGVIEGSYPDVPLLGMAFLGRLEMKRTGSRMELVKKY